MNTTYTVKHIQKGLTLLYIDPFIHYVDGVELEEGDLVLVTPNYAYQWVYGDGVFEYDGDKTLTRINADSSLVPGCRVTIEEGDEWAGKTFFFAAIDGSTKPLYVEEPSPGKAFLSAADGLTIANDIVVWGYEGSGTRAIGTDEENASVTYSGTIALTNSLVVSAARGSTVKFTGSLVDPVDAPLREISLDGPGLVVFPNDMVWAKDGSRRKLDLSAITLDSFAGLGKARCTIARGTGIGNADIILPAGDLGPWSISVGKNTINLVRGFTLSVR